MSTRRPHGLQSGMDILSALRLRIHVAATLAAAMLWLAGPVPSFGAVYLEDSPAAVQLAEESSDLLTQGRPGEAAQKLQQIAEDYADKLMPIDDTGYTDARRWVRQRLLDEPSLLRAYRSRYAAEAERAVTEALAEPPAQRELRLQAAIDRYGLTRAGIRGSLFLAGLYLERGDAAGAEMILRPTEGLMDNAQDARRFYELRGWAAAMTGHPPGVDTALSALGPLMDVEELEAFSLTLGSLRLPVSLSNGQALSPPRPPLDRPLWQVQIEPPAQGRMVVTPPRVAQSAAGESSELIPVASGSLLLINDNQRVYAIDGISGRLRWDYRMGRKEPTSQNANGLGFAVGRVIQDRRQVLVHGDRAYAVMGFAVPWQGRRRQQTIVPTQLIALDRDTGALRWAVTPGQLDATLERAAFHGTPVASGDQIIVMARRSQASSFQDSYLFSLDAKTGDLRWRRHLASTAGPNSRNVLPAMSSMTLTDGVIYLCDNLGAVAAVEARTGSVHWVRVLLEQRVDERGRPQEMVIPFSDMSRPQRCAAGLIVPMRVNQARGLLLDPQTGKVIQRFTSQSPFANAYDVQPLAEGDVLVIGPSLSRLAGDTLEPRWSTAIMPRNVEGVTPRVSLNPNTALVARDTGGLEEIALDTGERIAEHRLPWTGTVLATQEAWVVSSGQRLSGYLPWMIAYETLQRRAEAQPDSPDPGLNMAMLAINAGQAEASDEGVDLALRALAYDAVRREQDAGAWQGERSRVFGELLGLTERDDLAKPGVIERLFDRLAVTTETPAELLAYNLARGDFLVAQQRLAEAVDFYQAILLDPQQAGESLVKGATIRRGDIAARLRLLQLAETHRSDFYERFDQQAQREFGALIASPSTDVEALIDLARRYPLARVSAEAILAAAELQAQSANPAGAATQYRRAFQLADNDDLRRRAAGGLANHYQSSGRIDAAVRWLEQVNRDHPGLRPTRDGVAVRAEDWLAELAMLPQGDRAGLRVRPPFGQTIRLPGNLVRTLDDKATLDRPGGVLYSPLARPGQWVFYDLSRGETRWTIDAPEAGFHVVDQGRDNLVFFSRQSGELLGLDAATGKRTWPAIQAMPLLADLGEGGLAKSRAANAGGLLSVIEADFGPLNQARVVPIADESAATLIVLAGEAVACVVDAKGRAFGMDRLNGQVLWQSALPVDVVTHARVMDDVLAVAGTVSPGTEAQSGRLLLIDLATGRLRFPAIEDQLTAVDLRFTPGAIRFG